MGGTAAFNLAYVQRPPAMSCMMQKLYWQTPGSTETRSRTGADFATKPSGYKLPDVHLRRPQSTSADECIKLRIGVLQLETKARPVDHNVFGVGED